MNVRIEACDERVAYVVVSEQADNPPAEFHLAIVRQGDSREFAVALRAGDSSDHEANTAAPLYDDIYEVG